MSNLDKVTSFTNATWDIIFAVAADNAVRLEADAGVTLRISKAELREAMDCKRVTTPLIESVKGMFASRSALLEITVIDDGLSLYLPPLLRNSSSFGLESITQYAGIIKRLGTVDRAVRMKPSPRIVRVKELPEILTKDTIYFHPDAEDKLTITVVGNDVSAVLSTSSINNESHPKGGNS